MKGRRNLLFLAFICQAILVAIPSYPIYKSQFPGEDFSSYFLSLLFFQSILFIYVFFDRYKMKWPSQDEAPRTWTLPQRIAIIAIILISFGYILFGINAYGGVYAPLDAFNYRTIPVPMRSQFWREVLPSLPFASLFRFIAKTGSLYMGIWLLQKEKKIWGAIVLALSLAAVSLEATKSSLIIWALPILFFLMVRKKHNRIIVAVLIFSVAIGTVWLGMLEANLDMRVAVKDKVLGRIFVTPASVSMAHYSLFRDTHLYGATDPTIMALRGGISKVLATNALDYDNYVYRWVYYPILGYEPTYGSVNAPAFVYGWVDFAVPGVMLTAVLIGMTLLAVDKLIARRILSTTAVLLLIYPIIMLMTSQNYIAAIWGLEGAWLIIGLDLVINRRLGSKGLGSTWVILSIGAVYNMFGFIVRLVTR